MTETTGQSQRELAGEDAIPSALRQALLHSERLRILGVLAVLGIMAVIVVVRWAFAPASQSALSLHLLVMVFAYGAYETAMLGLVRRVRRADHDLPAWQLRMNVVVETSAPTIALFLVVIDGTIDPYLALSAPVVLSYFFFIMLSALRLRPSQCLLSGVVAAAGYAMAAGYVYQGFPRPEAGDVLGPAFHATQGVMLLIGSLVAAAVASQIRKHMLVSIREAEIRRQMEEELRVARAIQQSLLPETPPEASGYDVVGWSEPAQETGGDHFDWLPATDGRTVVTLADVTGHGIGPALVTANCHSYVHAILPDEPDLSAAMQRLNNLLMDDLPDDRFVTFVAAVLGSDDEAVEMLSAGHGPLLHYRAAEGRVDDFNAHAPPLGMIDETEYPSPQQLALRPGDMLILITDGFFEWANPDGEQFGIDRLKQSILAAAEMPGDQVIRKLHEDVLTFARGTPQLDDLTAVIITRRGTGGSTGPDAAGVAQPAPHPEKRARS